MIRQNKKIILLAIGIVSTILFFVAIKIVFLNEKYSTLDRSFIQNEEIINKVAGEFGLSPRVMVSVIYAERGLNYSYLDEQLDFLLIESGVNASSGFCQVKYHTAKWIEAQISNPQGRYWINSKIALIIGKSKNQKELIEKLASVEMNVRYAAAYLTMIINRWKKDSIDISYSPDTLASMYSSGIRSLGRQLYINIVGRTASAFYESDRLKNYFPKDR